MKLQVLGTGCARCHETLMMVYEAVKESGVVADVEPVQDIQQIAQMGVFTTPGLVLDGQVKCSGRIPTKQEVLDWIKEAAA